MAESFSGESCRCTATVTRASSSRDPTGLWGGDKFVVKLFNVLRGRLCAFTWTFKFDRWPNLFSQWGHFSGLSLKWTVCLWILRGRFPPKDLGHMSHLKGFFLRWTVDMWIFMLSLRPNPLPQYSQEKGRALRWTAAVCLSKLPFWPNWRPQSVHENGRALKWVRDTCRLWLEIPEKLLPQSPHSTRWGEFWGWRNDEGKWCVEFGKNCESFRSWVGGGGGEAWEDNVFCWIQRVGGAITVWLYSWGWNRGISELALAKGDSRWDTALGRGPWKQWDGFGRGVLEDGDDEGDSVKTEFKAGECERGDMMVCGEGWIMRSSQTSLVMSMRKQETSEEASGTEKRKVKLFSVDCDMCQ